MAFVELSVTLTTSVKTTSPVLESIGRPWANEINGNTAKSIIKGYFIVRFMNSKHIKYISHFMLIPTDRASFGLVFEAF